MLRRSTTAIIACAALVLLTACGIKGPLRLPADKAGSGAPEVTPPSAPLSAPTSEPSPTQPLAAPPSSRSGDKKQ